MAITAAFCHQLFNIIYYFLSTFFLPHPPLNIFLTVSTIKHPGAYILFPLPSLCQYSSNLNFSWHPPNTLNSWMRYLIHSSFFFFILACEIRQIVFFVYSYNFIALYIAIGVFEDKNPKTNKTKQKIKKEKEKKRKKKRKRKRMRMRTELDQHPLSNIDI